MQCHQTFQTTKDGTMASTDNRIITLIGNTGTAEEFCSFFASTPSARQDSGSLSRLTCVDTEVEVLTFRDVRRQGLWMQPIPVSHGERPRGSIILQGDLFTL